MSALAGITSLNYQGKELFLLGTAHVSKESVAEVERVIEELQPDTVCVELDPQRYAMLKGEEVWRKLRLGDILRQGRAHFTLGSLLLSAYQRKMGEKLGVLPGSELLAAAQAAERRGSQLVLADREVQITLKRTWAALRGKERARLLLSLVLSPGSDEAEVDAARIEEMKSGPVIGELLNELAQEFPSLQKPLIDERDAWLISMTREAPGQKILAVVGAAHVAGMKTQLEQPVDRLALAQVPEKTLQQKLRPWLLPTLLWVLLFLAFRQAALPGLQHAFTRFGLPISLLAVALGLLARAHFLTLVCAAVLTPVAALLPIWPVAYWPARCELGLRPPTDEDKRDAALAATSLAGLSRNRVTHLLLLTVMLSLAVKLGALIGLFRLLSSLIFH